MKRNIRSFIKFVLLSGITIISTVLIYRLLRAKNLTENALIKREVANVIMPVAPVESEIAEMITQYEKIDWHDYEAMKADSLRKGLGEQGVGVKLKASELENYDKLYKENGFNAALSDKIALDRSLPDIRHPGCKSKKYLKKLPNVSVVVPFHNEHWSTLLRTATSVINRSPPSLLKEIILVDDCSTKAFSKAKLDNFVAANLTKTRVVHLPRRSGLILARLAGAKVATGDVLIFLDSHTEASYNWLPPLLEPIAQDYRTCVCPFIDVVAFETFEYRAQDEGARGAFDWEFFYKRLPLLPTDLEHPTEPFKSPVMAGGLFAISTKFFWELEGYDEGLDIWGGEQYELSFKIWQCGGQMVDAPCSRVGHIYRKFAPFPNPGRGDFVGKNYRRVAEVWMDEYAQYLYLRRPHYKNIDPGDLTKQKALRQRLNCKSFKWFIENIAFDLPLKYPPIEPPNFGIGEIRNLAVPELCVDANNKQRDQTIELNNCIFGTHRKGEQNFTLTWHKDLRPTGRNLCLDVPGGNDKAEIILYPCHGMQGNQYWRYDVDKQWFVHGGNPRCLDCDPGARKLFVTICNDSSRTQKWRMTYINLTMIAEWRNVGPPM